VYKYNFYIIFFSVLCKQFPFNFVRKGCDRIGSRPVGFGGHKIKQRGYAVKYKIIRSQPKLSTAFVLCMVFEPQDSFIKIDSLSFELRKLVIFGKNKKEKKISNTIQQ